MCLKVTTNSFGILLQNFLQILIPMRGRCRPYLRYINGTFLPEMSIKKRCLVHWGAWCIVGTVYKHKHMMTGGVFPKASRQKYCSHTEFIFSSPHAIIQLCNIDCSRFSWHKNITATLQWGQGIYTNNHQFIHSFPRDLWTLKNLQNFECAP